MTKKDCARPRPYSERPYFRQRLSGMEDAEAFNASLLTPLVYRNSPGYRLDLSFEGGGGHELSLFKTASPTGFRTSTIYEMDIVTIRFVLEGHLSRHDRRGDIGAKAGLGLFVPFSADRHEETSPGYEAVAAVIDRETFSSHLHALEGDERPYLPEFATVADASRPGIAAFLSSLLATQTLIRNGIPASDVITPLLQEVLIYQFLGAWPRLTGEPRAPETFAPPRKLRTALDFIESHLCTKLRVSDVAAACGMSVRNLQLLFKRETGRSIVQTINDLRLERVQRDLREDPTLLVSQVAYRWGFVHMGDFSQRYRERFGHLPSETRRGRADAPHRGDGASHFIHHLA